MSHRNVRGPWPSKDLGQGVLLLFNDYDVTRQDEFEAWYSREHLPERILGIPGFTRGRRYVAADGDQPMGNFLTVYEMEEPAVLASSAYLDVLDDPSEWTTEILDGFQRPRRTGCRIEGRFGIGFGGMALAVVLPPDRDTASAARVFGELGYQDGLIAGLHLSPDLSVTKAKDATAEGQTAPESGPVQSNVLILDTTSGRALESLESVVLDRCTRAGVPAAGVTTGRYQFAYSVQR